MSDNNAQMTLSAVLELKDRLTAKIKSVNKSLDGVKQATERVDLGLNTVKKDMGSVGQSASTMAKDLDKTKIALNGVKGSYMATVGLKDNATTKAKGIETTLKGIGGKVYTATVNIRQNGAEKLAGLKNSMSNMASGMMMGLPLQVAGMAGLGYGVMDTINTYKNFEKQMATVKAIATSGMGVNEANAAMERMTAKAREMGAVTQFSAEQVGKAFEYMAMAGWKEQQMMAGIKPVLDLALAAGEDLGTVSDIVTDSMTALKIDTRGANANANIKGFTDILAATATNSNTTVGMMGEAFKYAAAPAGLFASAYGSDEVGVAKDVALALGLMADSGIKASMAGTALRSTLTRMTADTIPTANAMKMLGINIMQMGADGTQQLKPLRAIFDDLRKKFKEGVSAEELVNYAETLSGTKTRNKEAMITFAKQLAAQGGKMNDKDKAKFAKMFAGEEALSGWLAIITASDEDYQKKIAAIDNSRGAADEMSKKRADTLAGDLEILKSAWHDFQIELMSGKGASGLRDFVQGLSKDVNQFKTSLKDGFDIGDIGSLALNVLKQLKDKFLELDGVGSILAGGALVFGLTKIYGLAKKAYDSVKTLAGNVRGGGALTTAKGPVAETVGTMTVNATTVYVNGKTVAGAGAPAGGNTTVAGGGGSRGGSAGGGARARLGGALAGAGIMAAFSAFDIFSTQKENAELLAEAAGGLNEAADNLKTLKEAGASADEIAAAETRLAEMKAYQTDVQTQADIRMDESVGGAVGGVIGAGVGTALMGPVGGAIGAFIGEEIGRKAGDAFHNMASGDAEQVAKWTQPDKALDDMDRAALGEDLEYPITITAPDSEDIQNAIQSAVDGVGTVDFTAFDENAGIGLKALWTDVAANAQEAGATIREDSQITSESVLADAAATESYFESSVYDPLQSGALETADGMTVDFTNSATATQGAWAGVQSFFSGLFASLKAEAAECASNMAQSMANAAANLRANGHTTLAGAADWVGNNLAWLGGTDYPHHASGTSWTEGGFTEINEHGGEIVDLPTGSRVYPHATTQKLIKEELAGGNDAGGDKVANISITGNTFTVREEADIDKIAYKLYQLIEGAQVNYNPI
jgi:TP901 family phage tail tape measure protein